MTAVSPTFVVVVAAALVAALPGLHPWLVYDRGAILSGEVWRLFTGNWVHFSASHLVCDAAVLGAAGFTLERRHAAAMRRIALLAPWVIGIGLLALDPRLAEFGGLSGLASAALAAVAVDALHGRTAERSLGVVIVVALAAKTLAEWWTGQPLLALGAPGDFQPVPLCHLIGAGIGVLAVACTGEPGFVACFRHRIGTA